MKSPIAFLFKKTCGFLYIFYEIYKESVFILTCFLKNVKIRYKNKNLYGEIIMSKIKKLFMLALCLAIIGSVFCVAVMAEGEPTKVLCTKGSSSDYEGLDFEYNANVGDPGANMADAELENGMGGRHGIISSAKSGGNGYIHFWNTKGTHMSTTPSFFGIKGGYFNNDAWSAAHYDFVTADFDICADSYIDENGNFTDENTGKLSYPTGAYMEFYARGNYSNQSGTVGASGNNRIYFYEDANGVWYLVYGTPSSYATPDNPDAWKDVIPYYELPRTAGEWTHLTFVFDISNDEILDDSGELLGWTFSQSDFYVYVNGNLFLTREDVINPKADTGTTVFPVGKRPYSNFAFDSIRFSLTLDTKKDVSLGIDNTACHYYEKGYTGGLDKVVADPAKTLAEADTAIAGRYVLPYPNKPIANIGDVDYYIEGNAFEALEENSKLELQKDMVATCNVKFPFTVDTNGYKFNHTTVEYDRQEIGEMIYFTKTTDPLVIIFDGSETGDATNGYFYDDSSIVSVGGVPKFPKEIQKYQYALDDGVQTDVVMEYHYDKTLDKMLKFIGWSTEKGATEPMETLPTITQEDVYYGVYFIYPVYEIVDCAYFVEIDGQRWGYLNYESLSAHTSISGAKIIFNERYDTHLSIENNLTLVTGDSVVTYYSETQIASFSDGVYTFRDVTASDYVELKWLDYADGVIETWNVIPGNTFDVYDIDAELDEFYYDAEISVDKVYQFIGWAETKGQSTAMKKIFTVPLDSQGLSLYPARNEFDCRFYTVLNGVKTGYHTDDSFYSAFTVDGIEIILATDYPELLYIENNIKIVTNGHPIQYYSAKKIADVEDGVYTFRDVTDDDYVDVVWLDYAGGEVIRLENQIPGNTINIPNIDNKIPGNVMSGGNNYYTTYANWYPTHVVTAGENRVSPNNLAEASPEINIQGIKYNFSALSYFKLNLYLPIPVTNDIEFLNAGAVKVSIGGAEYWMLPNMATINADTIDELTVQIRIKIQGEEQVQDVTVSLPEYFNAVLEKEDVTAAEKNLILAAINYCNEAYKLCNDNESHPDYDAIVSANRDFFDAVNAEIDGISATSIPAAVKKYITGITLYFETGDFRPTYAFVVKSQTSDGYVPGPGMLPDNTGLADGEFGIVVTINGVTYGTKRIEIAEGEYILVVDETTATETIPAFSMNDKFKFTVSYSQAGQIKTPILVKNKTYDLASYILGVGDGNDSLGRALYALASAADAYNTEAGKSDDVMIIEND